MRHIKDKRNPDYSKTLVLDKHYMPRSIISSLRAFDVWYKGNAEIVEYHPALFGVVNKNSEYYKPSIIKVKKDIRFLHFAQAKLNRENVFLRDGYQCVYCGDTNRKHLTIDHVNPRSKGGKDTWENLVTACKKCNNEKDNLTIIEWGREHPNPKRPHYLMLVKKLHYIPEEWQDYLFLK